MNRQSENRMRQGFNRPALRPAHRRLTLRTALLAMLVIGLLCGVAVAAITWGSREYLSHTEPDGTTHLNEELAAYAQPVGRAFQSECMDVKLIDAIYDGRSIVLTWTMQSLLDTREGYLLCDILVNGEYMGQGSLGNVDELFIKPGEIIESGISVRVDEKEEGDTCEVSMKFSLLTPNGELVEIGAMDGEGTATDYANYQARIDELNEQGKVVIAPDGVIELGYKSPAYEEGMTRADILAASGVMDLADELECGFTMDNNAESLSALPDGQPIEKDNGTYILRVIKAEMTPNSATFALERVFADEAAAKAFSAYYSEKLGPYWGFSFRDEDMDGDTWWADNSGGSGPDAPEPQTDGTWVWPYEATMVGINWTPKTITVVPYRDNPETGEYSVPHPDEGVTLTFEAK